MSKHSGGFTMIELLIAMTVFSFMLMIASVAFINIVRIHQAGIASRAVAQNARLILDEIFASARQSTEAIVPPTGLSRVCFQTSSGVTEYQLDDNSDILTMTSDRSCPVITSATPSALRLNDSSVEFTHLDSVATDPSGIAPGTYFLTLTAASRNNMAALNPTGDACIPGAGSQFCSVTTVSSTAALRGAH